MEYRAPFFLAYAIAEAADELDERMLSGPRHMPHTLRFARTLDAHQRKVRSVPIEDDAFTYTERRFDRALGEAMIWRLVIPAVLPGVPERGTYLAAAEKLVSDLSFLSQRGYQTDPTVILGLRDLLRETAARVAFLPGFLERLHRRQS